MDITFRNSKLDRATPFLLAFLAVATIGMATTIGTWHASRQGLRTGSRRAGLPAASVDSLGRKKGGLQLYLVDSPEQWDSIYAAHDAAATERATSGIPDPESTFLVMQDTTPEEELSVQQVLKTWANSTGGVTVIDYREK